MALEPKKKLEILLTEKIVKLRLKQELLIKAIAINKEIKTLDEQIKIIEDEEAVLMDKIAAESSKGGENHE